MRLFLNLTRTIFLAAVTLIKIWSMFGNLHGKMVDRICLAFAVVFCVLSACNAIEERANTVYVCILLSHYYI